MCTTGLTSWLNRVSPASKAPWWRWFQECLPGSSYPLFKHFVVVPLIEKAETYERAALVTRSGSAHEDEHTWRPENGWERTSFTFLSN